MYVYVNCTRLSIVDHYSTITFLREIFLWRTYVAIKLEGGATSFSDFPDSR